MINFDNIIEELIDNGIRVTAFKRDDVVYFDLNLDAKSYLHLSHNGEGWTAHMRYKETRPIRSLDDIIDAALDGMHGRSYISDNWKEFITKQGYTVQA